MEDDYLICLLVTLIPIILHFGGQILYVAFSNDIIIFTCASDATLTTLKDLLQLYQLVLGQKINAMKSTSSTRASPA